MRILFLKKQSGRPSNYGSTLLTSEKTSITERASRGSWCFGYPMCYHQGFRNVHIFSSVACSTGLIWCWIFIWQPCQCSIDCGTAQLHCSASNTLCFLYQTRMMHCQRQMHIPDTALGVCRHYTYSMYNSSRPLNKQKRKILLFSPEFLCSL